MSIENNPYLESVVKITDDKTLIADGPLSLQFTKALNDIYKKEVDEATGIALETQAIDAVVSKSLWVTATNARKQLNNTGQDVGLLYGVSASDAGISDIISITDSIGEMTEEEKENSVIIIDSKISVQNNGELEQDPASERIVNPYTEAISNIAQENNIEIYYSLEEFVGSTKLKDGRYAGTISGKKVSFKIDKKTHKFTNEEGVKGKGVPCTVVVKKGDVYEIIVDKAEQ